VTFPTPGVMFQGGVPIVHQGECVGAIVVVRRAVARRRTGVAQGRRQPALG